MFDFSRFLGLTQVYSQCTKMKTKCQIADRIFVCAGCHSCSARNSLVEIIFAQGSFSLLKDSPESSLVMTNVLELSYDYNVPVLCTVVLWKRIFSRIKQNKLRSRSRSAPIVFRFTCIAWIAILIQFSDVQQCGDVDIQVLMAWFYI